MEITQPSVTIIESLISPKQNDSFIGIPVFIGYTSSPVDKT
ncbi:hypothetical protein [Photorhabdus laumondii]|nr:hypothetical protein [Photorhabdus laumondii]